MRVDFDSKDSTLVSIGTLSPNRGTEMRKTPLEWAFHGIEEVTGSTPVRSTNYF